MQSHLKLLLAAVAIAGLGACGSTHHASVAHQEMDEATAMARMEALAKPGPQHAELAKMVGTWDHAYKMRFGPDQPWQDSTGTGEATLLLGGRFLQEKISMKMPGMEGMPPVEGLSILGYSNYKQEWNSFWTDSWSTWWVTSAGKDDGKGTSNFKGTMIDFAGERPFRMVIKHISANEHTGEMYDTMPDGKEWLCMTMHSKKRNPR
jgi:hypothetical protein